MRIPFVIGSLVLGSLGAAQTTPPRRLSLIADVRLDGRELKLLRDPFVVIGPQGQIVITTRYGTGITLFDSTGKDLGWKVPTGRRDDAEIGYPTTMGWIGGTNTMWVGDPSFNQVALIDAHGKITKSIEYPSWIHPKWAERRTYPVFGRLEPLAVYKDETMLVIPSRKRSLIDTPGYDTTQAHLLRTTWSGTIERTIARLPPGTGRGTFRDKNCSFGYGFLGASIPIWATSIDGMRVVTATPGNTAADSATIRVVALSDRGDTIFSRRYPQPIPNVPPAGVDEYLANFRNCGQRTAEQVRDTMAKVLPKYKSMLDGVRVGRDASTWLIMRAPSDSAKDRIAMILDSRGELVGTVAVPRDDLIVDVGRDYLWVVEGNKINRSPTALIRFKVGATAAPPARSGRGGASSNPSPPPA